ncbi:hypothetical protein NEOKW01_1930 [Nematocida sp. AWRm80]|nr:hypothetical protein NEOKW01_1930 [Nematocida sp. AWRm80]
MMYKRLNSAFYLTPKLLYIAVNLEYFLFYNFRHPFLESHKVPKGLITLTFSMMYLCTFFGNMGFAYFADKTHRPKAVLIGCLLISSILFQLLFISSIPYVICTSFVIYSMFILATIPLLDRLVLEYLQKVMEAPASMYGRQRMFGTFTYLVSNYIMESIVFDKKHSKEGKYSRLQPLYVVFALVAASLVFILAPGDRVRNSSSSSRSSPQITKVLKNPPYLFFLFIILLNGITRGIVSVYLSTYYKSILDFNDLSPPSILPNQLKWIVKVFYDNPVSTCSGFGVALEILIFFCSKSIVQRLGLYWAFLISQIAQGIRFFAYRMISPSDPYRFEKSCMLELMKGVNFGLTHLSGVQLAVLLVPSNLKTTSQMIYAGTFLCLGGIGGVLVGHFWSIETYAQAIQMFTIGGILSAIAVALAFIKYGFIDGKLWGRRSRELPVQIPSAQSTKSTLPIPAK